MKLSSFFKKSALILSLFLIGASPVLAQTEEDFFPNAMSNAEVSIVEDGPVVNPVVNDQVEPTTTPSRVLISEPVVRVGLYKTSEPIIVKSDFDYQVWTGNALRGIIPAGERVELSYLKGLYTIKSPSLEFGSKDYIRLVPQDPSNFFTIVNYSRPLAGRNKINFNVYRGTLEYRYSPKSNLPYIIDELPLDLYTAGIAETSDATPVEYMKALSVAARSYANAFIVKTPPTEKRMFDVYATTADQLYLGYNSEVFMPNYVKAAQATAGELVTYNSNPVITFYFSHSNGKTVSGGKDRPWLKSVTAAYDKGKKMLGHGIGMSNYDAQQHAARDSWDYKQILQYYYSDTEVERVF